MAKSKYNTLAEAAASGDRRETLLSLRDTLAKAIDDSTQARDTAALARNLQNVLAQIDELPEPEKDPAEEFSEKSKSRRKGA